MNRKEIKGPITDQTLNNTNHNFKELYNKYREAGLNAEDARAKALRSVFLSETAERLAKEANLTAEQVKNELSNIIIEAGTSDAETIQARGAFPLLNDRLDSNDLRTAQTEDRNFKSSLLNHKGKQPMVLWIDDDGHRGVYTKIAPLLREFNIKMSSAIITNRAHGFPIPGLPPYNPSNQFMSYDEMKELENEGIVEFVAHSHTHDINHRLTDMTEEEMHIELQTNKDILRRLGWNHRQFVYPFGSENATVHSVVRQYFQSAFDVGGGSVATPLNQFKIPRISCDGQDRTAQEVIEQIDVAIDNNSLAVLTTHVDQYGGLDMDKMKTIAEHVLDRGVKFVTADEAMNEFGNLLQLSDDSISHDGEIHGKKLGVYRNGHLDFEPNADITQFKKGTVTRLKIRSFEVESNHLPKLIVEEGGYGYIEVHRDTTEDFFSFRRFTNVITGRSLISKWDTNTDSWLDWNFLSNTIVLQPNTRRGDEPLNKYPKGVVSVVYTSDRNAASTPDNLGGTLTTYRLTNDDSGAYQEFKPASFNAKYTRRWLLSVNAWTDWEHVGFRTFLLPDSVTPASTPNDFPERKESVLFIRDNNSTGFPENLGGILTTYRLSTDNAFIYQEYKIRNANKKYMRTWSSSGWGDWELT